MSEHYDYSGVTLASWCLKSWASRLLNCLFSIYISTCFVNQQRKHRRPISLVLCKGIHIWLDFTHNASVMHKTYQCQMINVLCVMPVWHVLICRCGHKSQYFWWKIDTVNVYVNHQRTMKCWSPWSVYSPKILWLHRQHGYKGGFQLSINLAYFGSEAHVWYHNSIRLWYK